MHPFKMKLLATTVLPLAVAAAGVTAGTSWIPAGPGPALAACAPCNPCAAANPCNPCAAANPCNPCASANPCNPCGAVAPAATTDCVVPRLAKASANPCAAANPCNPCAVKQPAANPCNPCAVKQPAANPCNPCAAKQPTANPCNPCAAANPCNPCAAGGDVELSDAEAAQAYDCVLSDLRAAYMKSGNEAAANYAGWRRYSSVAYKSATHGGRYVQNYANSMAKGYGAFEKAGVMPVGSVLAKDSFTVDGNGKVSVGPLFLMEKMPSGFNPESGNWQYTMIMPTGAVFGVTNGKNSSGMQFCVECHATVAEEQDHMMFMPEEYRSR